MVGGLPLSSDTEHGHLRWTSPACRNGTTQLWDPVQCAIILPLSLYILWMIAKSGITLDGCNPIDNGMFLPPFSTGAGFRNHPPYQRNLPRCFQAFFENQLSLVHGLRTWQNVASILSCSCRFVWKLKGTPKSPMDRLSFSQWSGHGWIFPIFRHVHVDSQFLLRCAYFLAPNNPICCFFHVQTLVLVDQQWSH